MVILGIGNVLQKDDGIGVYAATYLNDNYTFSSHVTVVNGGVEGIKLLNIFMENDTVLILDTIGLEDTPGSLYVIPTHELGGYGLNSGGAHEIGVIQCLDMLELQGKALPEAFVMGIVPAEVTFDFALSQELMDAFEDYIKVILHKLKSYDITAEKKEHPVSLETIIRRAKDPSGVLID
ncbi:HyaD/HybD family hydrogenase maturation endopeptidase [Sulfurovum sp.]|uniref:HyaD/HybD family hydrogenase maturation endopeptidase n=1 Tax=Sulfurovum sp. TaxID=1969726 RepID=UPI0028681000|nr:HyaD/HybD family hydrogenase maturation endopeptidase [Sulfurovum sp.]